MKIILPAEVKQIIQTLQQHGYEAYAVGGCVRDSILGREPEDWDITTSAAPEETKRLFGRTFDTGIEHGTITVLLGKVGYEITTYRIDGTYEDYRHPMQVEFTRSLKKDLQRRDFTINAMAYNEEKGLIDLFGGMEDLKKGKIACVGNPKDRFGEDALRILRAVRFASQLGFIIEEQTKKAIRETAGDLIHISAERIQVEVVKMLVSKHPEGIQTACELGITRIILPEFDRMMETKQETPYHRYNVGVHTVRALQYVRAERILRLTMLLHDMGKPKLKTIDENGVAHFKMHAAESEKIAKQILQRLKFDNDTINKVSKLVLYHDYRMPAKPKLVRRAMNKIGIDLFSYYLEIRRADTLAQSEYLREEKLLNLDEIEELYVKIIEEKQCITIKDLAIAGGDLLEMGIPQGEKIGEILHALLEEVLDHPELNQIEILKEKARLFI